MKKHFLIIVIMLLALGAFALIDDDDPIADMRNQAAEMRNQNPDLQDWYDFSDAGVKVCISPDWILFEGEKLKRKEFRLAKNGYYYIKDNIVIFDQFHHLLSWHNTTLDFHPLAADKIPYGKEARYTPSSFFTETLQGKTISYDASNLNSILRKPYDSRRYTYMNNITDNERFFIWNEEHKPWVTQKTGETVTVEFDEDVNAISLLNGYVDPYHPDYYKKNARIKDIKITDEYGKEYFFTLADEVGVQSFMLGNCTKKVTLTVLSVYEGEKYGDICLSMFAGVYADGIVDWIIVRELVAAKKRAQYEYDREIMDKIPNSSLIEAEWDLYAMIVEDRIRKEFNDQSVEHEVEIYASPDLKIHLAAHDGYSYIKFFSKERIKKIGSEYKNFYVSYKTPFEKDDYWQLNNGDRETEKDGWIITEFHDGPGDQCALPLSVKITMQFESGKKQTVTISKEGLENVKRYGELVLGAFDWK
ncbi:MAG: hypothetical protein K6E51_06250 [Treponema sp.]|nr:hypothetical protein [Treponema sp.]